jgi:hypothetical protein
MREAEQSGRRTLDAQEACAALRILAVVIDEEPQDLHGDVVALVQTSWTTPTSSGRALAGARPYTCPDLRKLPGEVWPNTPDLVK